MSKHKTKHTTKVVNIPADKAVPVPQEIGNETDAAFYLLDAAIDLLEAAFSNLETHEKLLGSKNVFYVSPETMPTIFHLLYEAKEKTRFVKAQITF